MNANIALPQGILQSFRANPVGLAARSPRRFERSLGRREVFTVESGERLLLSCVEGMLWITLDGDGDDYVLASGQGLRIAAGQKAVIQALVESRFGLAPQ